MFFKGLNASVTALQKGGTTTTAPVGSTTPTPPGPNPPAIMPTNCADVKKMGGVETGFHIVKTTVTNKQSSGLQVHW